MKVKALRSFAGAVSMYEGEVREIRDIWAADLIAAGHVKAVEEPKAVQKPVEKPAATQTKLVEKPATKKGSGKRKKK